MATIRISSPATLHPPVAPYSHVAEAPLGARLVAIAGQVAVNRDGKLVGEGDIEAQATQVFANLGDALKAAGGDWQNVVQFMSFLTRREDLAGLAAWRKREFPNLYPGGAYPPNTLLIVAGLAQEAWLLEVQAIAAV